MVKFSFIIPHKNLPSALLRRCLDSIPHWENDVEIIIIDDNSDPNIVDFSKFPGLGEPCTEVFFTKEGKGPGFARNIGLQKAKGEWILFADADDFFMKDNLEKLLRKYPFEDYEAIGWKMHVKEISGEEYIDTCDCLFPVGDELTRVTDKNFFYQAKGPCQKMLRRDFIVNNNFRFDEFIGSEDMMFALRTATNLSRFALFSSEIYYYEKRANSLETGFAKKLQCTKMKASIRATRYLKSIGKMEYRDPATFLLWRLKHTSYWLFIKYLLIEGIQLGLKQMISDYKDVCKKDNQPFNPISMIWRKFR